MGHHVQHMPDRTEQLLRCDMQENNCKLVGVRDESLAKVGEGTEVERVCPPFELLQKRHVSRLDSQSLMESLT